MGRATALSILPSFIISSALTAVLFASYPFFVAIISNLKYGEEKLPLSGWLGMVVGFSGVILISADSLQTSPSLFLGTILALIAPFVAAYGILVHKHKHGDADLVVSITVQMIFGGIFLVAGALIFDSWPDLNLSIPAIGSIIYLALFGTVITFLGYYWLLRRVRIVTISMIAFITPLVAISIGLLFAGEAMTWPIAVGIGLILTGVLVVSAGTIVEKA